MKPLLTGPSTGSGQPSPPSFWQATTRHSLRAGIVALLLAIGTLTVYFTGGTTYSYPFLMLVPMLLSAAWYRIPGALFTAFVAGLLMALMPLNVTTGAVQPVSSWLVRLGVFLALGGFAGWLFASLRNAAAARENIMRTDPRSGLPNLIALEEALAKRLATPSDHEAPVGLIMVRIVDITEILEAMGADASDDLAVAVSRRLTRELTDNVNLYRYSTEELMLLLDRTDRDQIDAMARRLIDAGEENLTIQGVPLRAQLVMGSSLANRPPMSAAELINEARIALFAAIEKHRNHCHFSPAYRRRTVQAVRLISRVRRGLEQGDFELHYQPKIQLADDRICGCEGLIRWRDGAGGYLPPGLFMPKVENTTLISPVTRFVADEACQFAAQATASVSINFSVRNLLDEDLLWKLKELIDRHGIDPRCLEIEITESALMQDLVVAKRAIECIRDAGIGVSIDDFGTGYASFEYLSYLPITGLKIDRAFVCDLERHERARKLMTCMIDVGHALDLTVTAEGVETSGQRDILRELGCDQAQGFLYSPAMPARQYLDWYQHYAAHQQGRATLHGAC